MLWQWLWNVILPVRVNVPAIDEFVLPDRLYRSGYDSSRTIIDGSLSEDVMEWQHHRIEFFEFPPPEGFANEESISIEDKNGIKYKCVLPIVADQIFSESIKKKQKKSKKKLVLWLEALEPLKKKVLTHRSGWWIYEFSYQKQVLQYHVLSPEEQNRRPGVSRDEYMLGRFVPESSKPLLDTSGSKLIQMYDNGDFCMLPGGIKGPERRTEINYKCDSSSMTDYIEDVVEISTCNYVMTISSPRFCPLVESAHQKRGLIKCFPHSLESNISSFHLSPSDSEPDAEEDVTTHRKRQHFIIKNVASNNDFPHFSRLVNELLSDIGDIIDEITLEDANKAPGSGKNDSSDEIDDPESSIDEAELAAKEEAMGYDGPL